MRKVFIALLVICSISLIGITGYILYTSTQTETPGTGTTSSSLSTSSASSSTTSDVSVAGCEEVETIITVDLPELKAGRCDWLREQDGGIVAGVKTKTLNFTPPDDVNVCSFDSLSINESGEQTIYYDDQFLIALNGAILVASYENIFDEYPLKTQFAYRDFRSYTGPNAILGENISTENQDSNPPYCIGEVKGRRSLPGSCVVTKTQTTGPVKLTLEEGVARRLAKYMYDRDSWNFTVLATGDDDNTIDCRLSPMQVQIAVTAVPANCSCGFTDPVCGDGILDEGEACDDGNTVNGDGCNNSCQVETPATIVKNTTELQVVDGEIRVSYTIVAENPSDETKENVTVVDQLPAGAIGAESISNSGTYNSVNRTVSWNLGSIAASEYVTLTYVVVYDIDDLTIENGQVSITNTATVLVEGEPDDTDTEITEVDLESGAQITKSVTAAEDSEGNLVASYRLNITNTGDSPLTDYSVEDTYSSNIQDSWISNISNGGTVSNGQINWSGLSVAVGQSLNLTYTVTIPEGEDGTFQNVAILYDENDEEVDSDTETVYVSEDGTVTLPDTGLFDDSRTLGLFLIGMGLIFFGLLVNRMDAQFGWNLFTPYEDKILDSKRRR